MERQQVVSAKVFIIIVNWNGKETLKQCLTLILKYTTNPKSEIIVVDNGSTDQSVDMLQQEFPPVKVLKNTVNLGFSKANNQGIRYAIAKGAQYFLLLNNDVLVSGEDWLARMVGLMESDRTVGMVGCKLVYPDDRIQHAGGFIRVAGAGHRGDGGTDTEKYDRVESVDYVTGAALLTKSEVIRKIGLLDEGFTPLYCEDTDWCLRARYCGYKIVYTPVPTLVHKHGSSAKTLTQRNNEFYFKRSWIRFFLLNFQHKTIVKRLLYYEAMEFAACFVDRNPKGSLPLKVRLDYPKLTLLWKAWMANLGNLKDILAKRKQRFSCTKIES
jgi:GT2 family glycosyltransferase